MKTQYGIFFLILAFFVVSCMSGTEDGMRNKDVFDDAAHHRNVEFTTTALDFDGNIQALKTAIDARADNLEATCAATTGCPAEQTITGIVTIPSNYGVALGTTNGGCATSDKIFSRSFILQDKDAAILVAYGIEPPSQDTADAASAKYILNSRRDGIAAQGNKIQLTVTSVQKYGDATNFQPVVTDFTITSVQILSTANSIPYVLQSAASPFDRAKLYEVRQLEGYVTQRASYDECPSAGGTRQFQYNFQKGYLGKICVGATSYADALTCTGAKREFSFQMSLYLGAGTLSGFDTGDMFSYNIALKSKVRMTGPVFVPQYAAADSALSLMLGQRVQVETLP